MSLERGRGRDCLYACRRRRSPGRSRVWLVVILGQFCRGGSPEWSASLPLLLRSATSSVFPLSPSSAATLELPRLVPMVWDEVTRLRSSLGTSHLAQATTTMASFDDVFVPSFLLPMLSARVWGQSDVVTHLLLGGALYCLLGGLFLGVLCLLLCFMPLCS